MDGQWRPQMRTGKALAMIRLLLAIAALVTTGLPAPAPAGARPALWVARDADTTVWLFGTVHELRPGIAWLTGPVAEAFRASDTLILELVVPPAEQVQAELARTAPPRDAPPLPDLLPPGYPAKLAAAARSLGYPQGAFDRMDPWVAATTLSILPLRAAGFSRDQSPETILTAAARATGKPVAGLETQRAQIAMYDTLPLATQVAMLVRVLDGQAGALAGMERVAAAWQAGDVATLSAITAQDMATSGDRVQSALLGGRNDRWAATIAGWMRLPGTRFVAVGTGHLVGPDSVQERLRVRGVTVRRVQ